MYNNRMFILSIQRNNVHRVYSIFPLPINAPTYIHDISLYTILLYYIIIH